MKHAFLYFVSTNYLTEFPLLSFNLILDWNSKCGLEEGIIAQW